MTDEVVVVDASLAVAWVVTEESTSPAWAKLVEWDRGSVQRLVPCWFACEVASALYKWMRRGELSLSDAENALADVLAVVSPQADLPANAMRALALAEQLNQRHPYDCQYAALAEAQQCELWTADEGFFNVAHRLCPWVRWIGSSG